MNPPPIVRRARCTKCRAAFLERFVPGVSPVPARLICPSCGGALELVTGVPRPSSRPRMRDTFPTLPPGSYVIHDELCDIVVELEEDDERPTVPQLPSS